MWPAECRCIFTWHIKNARAAININYSPLLVQLAGQGLKAAYILSRKDLCEGRQIRPYFPSWSQNFEANVACAWLIIHKIENESRFGWLGVAAPTKMSKAGGSPSIFIVLEKEGDAGLGVSEWVSHVETSQLSRAVRRKALASHCYHLQPSLDALQTGQSRCNQLQLSPHFRGQGRFCSIFHDRQTSKDL